MIKQLHSDDRPALDVRGDDRSEKNRAAGTRGDTQPFTDLCFVAAACQLAREIFMARKAAYHLDDVWFELPKPTRDVYIRQAADILIANRPPSGLPLVVEVPPVVEVSKIVGRITPSEPYGVDL